VQKAYPKNGFVRLGIEIARSHHERWDGTGYSPRAGGHGHSPLGAYHGRGDSYDAARSRRFYKPPLPHAECCAAIYRRSGQLPRSVVVEAFRALEARFSSVAESLDE